MARPSAAESDRAPRRATSVAKLRANTGRTCRSQSPRDPSAQAAKAAVRVSQRANSSAGGHASGGATARRSGVLMRIRSANSTSAATAPTTGNTAASAPTRISATSTPHTATSPMSTTRIMCGHLDADR